MPKYELIPLFWAVSIGCCITQEYFTSVQHYTVEDGLSDNYTADSYVDSKGYVWISTTSGFNRFDGHEFIHYSKEKAGLTSNYVEKIFEDRNGKLWVVSRGKWNSDGHAFFTKQIDVFDPGSERGTPMKEFVSVDFEDTDIRWYSDDHDKNIWISTRHGKLYKYDGQQSELFFQKEISSNWDGSFAITSDGKIGIKEHEQFLLLDQSGIREGSLI